MKISTRGRYSLRMMLNLASHYNDGYISLNDIAQQENISKKYLEQIIPLLNKEKLLLANKGHLGGYKLSKSPSQITVKDVLIAAEGSIVPVSCMEDEVNLCEKAKDCITLPLYKGLYEVISDYLDGITLQSILDGSISRDK